MSEVLANIIKGYLSRSQADDDPENQDNQNKTKRKLLDKLLTRIYDKHAFARSHVVGIWIELCQEDVVPKEYLLELLKSSCDRLKDVSAHVRKKSIQLLSVVISIYHKIFVPQTKKSFIHKDEISKEIQFTLQEKEDIKKQIKRANESAKQLIEDSEEYNEMQNEINSMQKRLEESDKVLALLEEYKQILVLIDSVSRLITCNNQL